MCLSAVTVAMTYRNNISTNDKLWFDKKIYSFEEKIEMYLINISLYSLLIFDLQYG